MTTIADYLGKVPSANAAQPNFIAALSAALQPLVDVQNLLLGLPHGFDLDAAVDKQLDAVGERIGASRRLPVPIAGVYFALDTAGVGLDQGILQGPHDPLAALVDLDNETYRATLKIKVMANTWDGSFGELQNVVGALSTNGTYVFVQDNFDMTMTVGVSGTIPSAIFISILKQIDSWFRPGAVDLPTIQVTSVGGAPIFGLDVENSYISGLDVGAIAIPN